MRAPQPMTAFEMMMAQWREMAKAENVACGLHAVPKLPELADKPKTWGRRATPYVVLRPLTDADYKNANCVPAVQERHRKIVAMLAEGIPLRRIAGALHVRVEMVSKDCGRLRSMGVIK